MYNQTLEDDSEQATLAIDNYDESTKIGGLKGVMKVHILYFITIKNLLYFDSLDILNLVYLMVINTQDDRNMFKLILYIDHQLVLVILT